MSFEDFWPFADMDAPESDKFVKGADVCCDATTLKASIVMESKVLFNDKRFLLGLLPGCPQVWSALPKRQQEDPDLVAALPLNLTLLVDVARTYKATQTSG